MTVNQQTSGIVLPFPSEYKTKEYQELTQFFIELFQLIPEDIELTVICNSDDAFEKLISLSKRIINQIIVIPKFNEIWLRDFMGLLINKKVYLPEYFTSASKKLYSKTHLIKLRKQVKQILDTLNFEVIDLEINLDCGNFIHNNYVAIITKKVIEDNPNIDVVSYLEDKLQLKIILVDYLPNDLLAHIDGYASFINSKTIGLSSYPDELISLSRENQILLQIEKQLKKNDFKIIKIFDRPILKKYNNIPSAKGIYVNNILLNKTVILPQFKLPYSKTNYNSLNLEVYQKLSFSTLSINSNGISELGGGLHCISWQF